MDISDDRGGKLKVALLSSAIGSVISGIALAIFWDKFPIFSILLSGSSIFGAFVYFRNRIRCVVSEVQIIGNSILYIVNKKRVKICKDEILKIEDSGFNSAPHEIIIYLRSGKTVEFFPSKSFGDFYQGKLKVILRSWLAHDP